MELEINNIKRRNTPLIYGIVISFVLHTMILASLQFSTNGPFDKFDDIDYLEFSLIRGNDGLEKRDAKVAIKEIQSPKQTQQQLNNNESKTAPQTIEEIKKKSTLAQNDSDNKGVEVDKTIQSKKNTVDSDPTTPLTSAKFKVANNVERESSSRDNNVSNEPLTTTFGSFEKPRIITRVQPKYPLLAKRKGKEGSVLLKLLIDETGTLEDVKVVKKAGFGFDEAAVRAVKKSTFLPAERYGTPIKSETLLPVSFTLNQR